MARKKADPLHTFRDIKPILDTALGFAPQELRFELETTSAAIVWRSRANKFRVALRQLEEKKLNLTEGEGSCIYDDLLLSLEKNVVIIRQRAQHGRLTVDGEEITPISMDEDEELY